MKKIAVIYPTRNNVGLSRFIANSIGEVFDEYAFAVNYFLDELSPGYKITADVHLLVDSSVITPARPHLDNFDNLVVLSRDVNSNNISPLNSLPAGTNALVVNDSYKSSMECMYSLYNLNISHINFFPFDREAGLSEKDCSVFDVAITPGEPHFVPPFIGDIIDIGPREISPETFFRLTEILSLDYDKVHRNIIKHIKDMSDPGIGTYNTYLNTLLKERVYNRFINASDLAVIIVNERYDIIFASDKANSKILHNLLSKKEAEGESSLYKLNLRQTGWFHVLVSDQTKDKLARIYGERYFISREPISVMDEILGYCITLRSEKPAQSQEQPSYRKSNGMTAKYNFSDIIHGSTVMEQCIDSAKTAARTEHTVLVTGQSGTGKELIAQSIHNYSHRSDEPFIAVNCAALPETLLESELFGYESGAFTGAKKSGKTGLFEQADGGTIFLDEIGDISPQMQISLLRVLQEKQIMRVGGTSTISVDTRVIAATNKNLAEEVKKGNFREDLFYRLNVITVNVPALSARKDDILPLMLHFLGNNYGSLTDDDKELLKLYSWPGNVRELESVATYFETFKTLPAYLNIYDESGNILPAGEAPGVPAFDKENIRRQILDIISSGTQLSHGIGRSVLSKRLKERGISIGDKNLREILRDMSDSSLITIGAGRAGMRITSKGYQTLKILGYTPK